MVKRQIWVGIDTAMDTSRVCAIDELSEVVHEGLVRTDASEVCAMLQGLANCEVCEVVAEATSTSVHLIRGLRAAGLPVSLLETRQASKYLRIRHNKTDNNDARGLAEIAKLGLPAVPRVHLKSAETHRLRHQLVLRHRLTRQRVACEQMLRAMFRLHGRKIGRAFKSVVIEAHVHEQLADLRLETGFDLSDEVLPLLDLCITMRQFLSAMDDKLLAWAKADPVCSRWLEIPGVGPICAISFYTAVEDPARFAKASDVGPFLGLTPRVLQSGTSVRHGRISRLGNSLTRGHLGMAACVLLAGRMRDTKLKTWGLSLAERAGRGKAKVAISRKLAVLMMAMWKSGDRFQAVYPSAGAGII